MAACLSHGISPGEFWDMTPRTLTALIRGFRKVEQERASITAFFVWGGKIEELEAQPKRKPSQKAAAAAFFM
jgi:hypothetical protein